jgi:hypothetical protein
MRSVLMLLVALWFSSLAAWSQQVSPPAGDGRIVGRVLTESGAPLEGAVVLALLSGTTRTQAPARFSAITGADGGYILDDLPPGRFLLGAEKPGYANPLQPGRIENATTVNLDSVDTVSGIDLVLRRIASIAGRVTRPDGTPIANVRVVLEMPQPDGEMLGTWMGALTNAAGRYRVNNVPPGTYAITAIYGVPQERIGGPVQNDSPYWARTFHPAATKFEDATPITIRGGERLDDIDITPQPQLRHRVGGFLLADNGSTLRNVRVDYASEAGMAGTITDVPDDGRFTLDSVSGLLTLIATADTDGGPAIGVTQVNVMTSLEGVQVVLGEPAQVRGRVTWQGGLPQVQPPLAVWLVSDWPRPSGNDLRDTASVDLDGRFIINNVIGERSVAIMGPMAPWEMKEVRRGGRVLLDGRLTLSAGQLVDDLEIVMVRRP